MTLNLKNTLIENLKQLSAQKIAYANEVLRIEGEIRGQNALLGQIESAEQVALEAKRQEEIAIEAQKKELANTIANDEKVITGEVAETNRKKRRAVKKGSK